MANFYYLVLERKLPNLQSIRRWPAEIRGHVTSTCPPISATSAKSEI